LAGREADESRIMLVDISYPPLDFRVFTFVAPLGLLSVIVLMHWLLIRGVDEDKWRS
jgi:hypothetical protein